MRSSSSDLRRVGERERRLDRLDDRLLDRLQRDAEGGNRLDRRRPVRERLARASLGAAQRRARGQVAGALLDVGRALEPREESEDAARIVELAALEVDVHARLEQAQHHAAGVDLLLV